MATPAIILRGDFPTIALVGRVNVGKSSLFNTLTEDRKAIVSPIPGTTRTNNEGVVVWQGRYLNLIDTGGLTFQDDVPLEADIIKQTEYAIEHSDIILFVTDAQEGVLPQEFELADRLKDKKDRIILLANKVDSPKFEPNIYTKEYSKLRMGEPFPVSAANGNNLGDLLEMIFEKIEELGFDYKNSTAKPHKATMQVSVMGKPNVGKSSLFNKLIGEDKVIVSEMAHTTREPYDTMVTYEHEELNEDGEKQIVVQKINFVDTAGIRRKSRVEGLLERVGIHKSIQTVTKSDIVLFVIDVQDEISHQDMQLAGHLEKHAKSVILVINKWDLIEDTSDKGRRDIEKRVRSFFPHLEFAPAIFVSGKTGFRVHQIFPEIMRVWEARHTTIGVKALEYFLDAVTKEHRPARGKGTRHPKLLGIRQLDSAPPVFEIAVKYRTSLHRSYVNFLENKLREKYNFTGTPLIIKLRKTKR